MSEQPLYKKFLHNHIDGDFVFKKNLFHTIGPRCYYPQLLMIVKNKNPEDHLKSLFCCELAP